MESSTGKWLTPFAVVAAGLLIAGALIYNNSHSTQNNPTASSNPTLSTQPLQRVSYPGNDNAPVTITEYSDFQCPFCEKFHTEVLPQIMDNYVKTGKVKFVYKDFPFLGQESVQAAEASKCAAEQGTDAYWNYNDYLFDNQGQENSGRFTIDNLKLFAANLGLDTTKFNQCLDSGKYASQVQQEENDGKAAGVTGTPSFLINGKLIVGAQPYSVFQQAIDQALQAAGSK